MVSIGILVEPAYSTMIIESASAPAAYGSSFSLTLYLHQSHVVSTWPTGPRLFEWIAAIVKSKEHPPLRSLLTLMIPMFNATSAKGLEDKMLTRPFHTIPAWTLPRSAWHLGLIQATAGMITPDSSPADKLSDNTALLEFDVRGECFSFWLHVIVTLV